MALTSNGWPALPTNRTTGPLPRLRKWVVPGANRHVYLRDGSAGFVLTHLALWFHRTIEPIHEGVFDEWGWAYRPIRGGTRLSNHAGGIAIDLNATRHPLGVPISRTFTPQQIGLIRSGLATYETKIRWGGEWSRPDGMHFEWGPGTGLADAERIAAKLLTTDLGREVLAANPGAESVIRDDNPWTREPEPTPVPTWSHRVVTQNLNFARPGTHAGILTPLMARPRVDVIGVQEAKHTNLRQIAERNPAWRAHQEGGDLARRNSGILVRKGIGEFIDEGVTFLTPARKRGRRRVMSRWAKWTLYRLEGDPRLTRFVSLHLPLPSLNLWPLGDAAIRRMVAADKADGIRGVYMGDWNRPNVLFARSLGLRVGNVGIDGFLTTQDVALSRVRRLPGNASDHDPVAAWIMPQEAVDARRRAEAKR